LLKTCFKFIQKNVLDGNISPSILKTLVRTIAVQNNGLSLTESGTLIRVFLKLKNEKQQNLLFVCKKI